MKKSYTAIIGIMLIGIIATGVSAYELGENRFANGGFEDGEVGLMPPDWELNIYG